MNHKDARPSEKLEEYGLLKELAMNLIWCWNHKCDQIWRQLDIDLWDRTHNPWALLQAISKESIKRAFVDPAFCKQVNDLLEHQRADESRTSWFEKTYPNSALSTVAYFSMEYMLSEALPIYSGGLGNVAGDQLKSASDLGVPVIAIGLLYQQGYFRQVIDKDGMQLAFYPYNSPEDLPIQPLRNANGEWLRFELDFPGWSVWVRAWEVKVGRATLYLLDSNDLVNYPPHRAITSELYGGGPEMRLQQELVLGIGGWRLLNALGIDPEICHLNEGHAAFAVLERAKSFMARMGTSFDAALAATRAGNLFTTHTAVPAGFDRFPEELIRRYLTKYAEEELKISVQDLLSLGRSDPWNGGEPFNMAYLALRSCAAVNGVSKLHGTVSQRIFESVFPRWPQEEIPIDAVTNGVHVPSWDSPAADELWSEHCGKERWLGTTEHLEQELKRVSDERLWEMRNNARKSMISYGRERIRRIWKSRGLSPEEAAMADKMFNLDALTLGFSRRFATYKRANMLLHNPARLIRILTNPERPVQLLIAGKAHPADRPGQAMIQEWVRFIQQPEVRSHVVFLTDYDMFVAANLVGGVDVWINTPRRPWEACGTSGMKVLANGGLNLSELDGWWAEAYCPEVGWALGDGKDRGNDPAWDAEEANQLYDLLENEVIPGFYKRNEKGIPVAWIARIRESMARLTPQYSANRTVREYTERFYLPGAKRYQERAANKGANAKQLAEWMASMQKRWPHFRFLEQRVQTDAKEHLFEINVDFGGLHPDEIAIELFSSPQLKHAMQKVGENRYSVSVPSDHPADQFTARARPSNPALVLPLELPLISWQK